ncbi:MAG: 7TM-DISM domain-containing protein, partial [Campylobacterota bacterium]|nr:7TM-DISM domain-containing protein [Campylobacterota bacterium]
MIRSIILLLLLSPMLFANSSLKLFYFEDKQGQHTIKSVQKIDFNQSLTSRFSLGYRPKNHVHWFAIDIDPYTKDKELMLYFTNLFAKDFTFYYQDSNGKWQKKETGYNESNRSKNIWTSKPTLEFNAKHNQRIYVKVESDVAIVGEFWLFDSLAKLIDYQSHYYLFFALFYGVLLMAMGIALFLFITLREAIYGYFLGYLLFTGSFVFMVNSLHSPFATPQIVHTFRTLTPVTVIFYVLFAKELLEIKRVAPRLNILF